MEQIWKSIDGFDNYEVSNAGQVREMTGKMCNQYDNGIGYLMVSLKGNDGKWKMRYIHRLVAEAFIPNPNNYDMVNHRDECKSNNQVNNLEWCDAKYNNNYGTIVQRGLKTKRDKNTSNAEKAVACLSNGKIVKVFKSINESARQLNTSAGNICSCIKGERKTCCGYTWETIEV